MSTDRPDPSAFPASASPSGMSRRSFVTRSAAAGAGLVVSAELLAACGSSGGGGAVTSSGNVGGEIVGKPKKGGTLQLGVSGGGSTDQLDAHIILSVADNARLYNLYEWLSTRNSKFELEKVLAEEYEPNKAYDEWTVRIKPDIEFHNGKTLTADDVIFSFQRILDPKTGAGAAPLLSFMDPNGMTKLDARTVRFKLNAPFVPFEDRVSYQLTAIVPIGYDPKNPVGTGPFKYKSFTPGQQSTFVAFENYRGPGPYVDELIIADYPQESARVNALISGQVDAIDAVPYSQIKVVEGNSALQILISETGAFRPLTMLVDTPPLKDVRVRQALRFIANRQQMIDQALAGQGRIANDLYTPQDPLFDKSLPEREQDLEKAKSLLKQAGQSNLSVELVTAPVQGGIVAASLVYAEQAKAAGVNVKVTQLDPTTFYNSEYLNRPFSVDWWSSNSYFTQVAYADGPGASYNDTHWENPKYDALYKQAVAQPNQAKAAELAHEMQKMQYEEGGNINWGYANGVDAYSKKITGFVPDYSGQGLNSFDCKKVWFV